MKKIRQNSFTIVEAVMAMLVVSILLVASMRATGAAARMQYKTAERINGRMLADGLMNDILPLAYEDPALPVMFGVESNESAASKINWDDVDDFNGWSESPPQNRDGTVMPNLTSWRRTVAIDRVNPLTPTQVMASETGAKRITVNVYHNSVLVATRVAIRTKAP